MAAAQARPAKPASSQDPPQSELPGPTVQPAGFAVPAVEDAPASVVEGALWGLCGTVNVQCWEAVHVAPSPPHLHCASFVHQPSYGCGSVPAGTQAWPPTDHWQTELPHVAPGQSVSTVQSAAEGRGQADARREPAMARTWMRARMGPSLAQTDLHVRSLDANGAELHREGLGELHRDAYLDVLLPTHATANPAPAASAAIATTHTTVIRTRLERRPLESGATGPPIRLAENRPDGTGDGANVSKLG